MIRNLVKSKGLWAGAVILFATLFAAGCGTTFVEKSGKMPNESTSKHVKGYQSRSSQAVKPVMPIPDLR